MAVTGPDLDDPDEAHVVDEPGAEPSEPWHNSTRAVVAASAAGVAGIGVLIAAVMYVTGGDQPQTSVDFVDPSFSTTVSAAAATTTTPTITSTPKVSTTEINGPPAPSTTSGSSETTSSDTESSSRAPVVRPPRQREDDGNADGPTSRRPRFNITRTLGPGPIG